MAIAGRVQSLKTFVQRVGGINPKKGHTLFFRGHSRETYESVPLIFRNVGGSETKGAYSEHEDSLFRSLVMRCPEEFVGCTSTLEHLVKMAHYGLPTRLLDLTTNPLVALYFASCSHHGKGGADGEVLVYEVPDKEIKFYDSDTVAVISNLAKMPRDFALADDRKRLLNEIRSEKSYFTDDISEPDLSSVCCVRAKFDNRRIIQQSGAFFLFGSGADISRPAAIPYKYVCVSDGHPQVVGIAKAGKKKIVKQLSAMSISMGTLFPEIDSVARDLKGLLEAELS